MGKYEIMYILSAELDEAARKAEIEKLHGILTNDGIEVKNVNEWGVRDFAYPIKKQTKGYYVVIKVAGEAEVGSLSPSTKNNTCRRQNYA